MVFAAKKLFVFSLVTVFCLSASSFSFPGWKGRQNSITARIDPLRQLQGGDELERLDVQEDRQHSNDQDSKNMQIPQEVQYNVQEPEEQVEVPSFLELLLFVLPVAGTWGAGSFLSLVDTAVVGRHNPLELAALGPATSLVDNFTYMFCFLSISTSSFLGHALNSGREDSVRETQRVLSHSFAMAIACGLTLIVAVQIFGINMLQATVDKASMEVIPASFLFSRVRVIGGMFILVNWISQAALTAAHDSLTPFKVICVIAFLNVFGDIFLVCKMGMGILGAAIATAGAEIIGCLLMITVVMKRLGRRQYPLVKFPSFSYLKKFLAFAGPVSFMNVSKVAVYMVVNAAATANGTLSLGAHQVIMRLFMFIVPFGDGVYQTAYVHVNTFRTKSEYDPRYRPILKRFVKKMIILSIAVGGVTATIAGLIPYVFPTLFTTEPLIIQEAQRLVPALATALTLQSVGMVFEGILLGKMDQKFMAISYGTTSVIVALYEMLFAARRGGKLELVWGGLIVYNLSRIVQFSIRLWWKGRSERRSKVILKLA